MKTNSHFSRSLFLVFVLGWLLTVAAGSTFLFTIHTWEWYWSYHLVPGTTVNKQNNCSLYKMSNQCFIQIIIDISTHRAAFVIHLSVWWGWFEWPSKGQCLPLAGSSFGSGCHWVFPFHHILSVVHLSLWFGCHWGFFLESLPQQGSNVWIIKAHLYTVYLGNLPQPLFWIDEFEKKLTQDHQDNDNSEEEQAQQHQKHYSRSDNILLSWGLIGWIGWEYKQTADEIFFFNIGIGTEYRALYLNLNDILKYQDRSTIKKIYIK